MTVKVREGESIDSLLRRFEDELEENDLFEGAPHRRRRPLEDEQEHQKSRGKYRDRTHHKHSHEPRADTEFNSNDRRLLPLETPIPPVSTTQSSSGASQKFFVGNLAPQTTEDDLRQLFSGIGNISSIALVTDNHTNRCKGFAFVEMTVGEDSRQVISVLNGRVLHSRTIRVDVARPRAVHSRRR
jgi:ribosomal protein S21